MRGMRLYIIGTIAMVLFGTTAYGNNPKLKNAIEISNILLKSFDSATNTATIEYQIMSNENVTGSISIGLQNSAAIKKGTKNTEYANIVKGEVITKNVTLSLSKSDVSMVSVNISLPFVASGYLKEYYRYFKIVKSVNSATLFDPLERKTLKAKEIGKEISLTTGIQKTKTGNEHTKSVLSQNYTIKISGQIRLDSVSPANSNGLYGNGVRLFFRNTNNPDNWYHPIYGNDRYTHFDFLDEQGNFSFNFTFTGDLSNYNQAIVIVNTANDASFLPVPADGYIVWENNGYKNYYNESEGVVVNIMGSSNNITVVQNGVINKQDGSIFRYMQLAREFIIQRYNGSVPFSVAAVETYKNDIEAAGLFAIGWNPNQGYHHYITIDPLYCEPSTITHEYGHFVNYSMWGKNIAQWGTANNDLQEGWAIFYSFAARNYIGKLYGDNIYIAQSNDDNTEYAPFNLTPIRYGNIRYATAGYPTRAAFGCYLWNLYDNYAGGSYEIADYNVGDNDDVSGLSFNVFHAMQMMDGIQSAFGIEGYEDSFNGEVFNSSITSSAKDIYHFMFDNLTAVPSHAMKSPQVTNIAASNISSSYIRLSWSPQSYPNNYAEKNIPTGYKLYKNVNGSWQQVGSSIYGANNIDIPFAGSAGHYRISSFNSTGDSYGANEKQLYTITLNTPNYLESGSGGSYKRNGVNIGTSLNEVYLQGTSEVSVEAVPPSDYYFVNWSDGVTLNPRMVSPSNNTSLHATFKAHFRTNNDANFESAGSHKFIRTGDGTLHLVYRSTQYLSNSYSIFYETSTDNGATWRLRYSGVGYGDPAIAAVNNNRIVLAYPSRIGYNGNIVAVCYDLSTSTVLSTSSVLIDDGVNEPNDVSIAITSNGKILVAWYNSYADLDGYFIPGYYARFGSINSSGVMSWLSYYSFEGNSLSSPTATHGAIDVRLHEGDGLFHFAFEDFDSYGNKQIYYCPLIYSQGMVQWYVYSPYDNCLSSSSWFENSRNPSFIAMTGSEETRFNWLGDLEGDVQSVFKAPTYYRYWSFGYNVTSSSINKASDGYAIGWSNGYDHSYTTNSTLYELGNISSTGGRIQMGNSDLVNNMRAMGFNTSSSPYVFNLSSPIGSMQKSNAQQNTVALGRSGVISIATPVGAELRKDSTKIKKALNSYQKFAFTIDNVVVDGQAVKFIDIPESVKPEDAAGLNSYLVTEPFSVQANSSVTYDVAFGATNSDKASETLKQNKFVNFRVELIDAKTQQVLGVLNTSNNSENRVTKRQANYFDVDCRGIRSNQVQLRLVVATNAKAQFSVGDKVVRVADMLRKDGVERTKISYQGSSVVTSYALEQNYPNPFNPATTITYQVPKQGRVTMKVYDVLGKEIATLINEEKAVGRYSTTFDGSRLSSGTYIVRMNAGDFVKTIKVTLLK